MSEDKIRKYKNVFLETLDVCPMTAMESSKPVSCVHGTVTVEGRSWAQESQFPRSQTQTIGFRLDDGSQVSKIPDLMHPTPGGKVTQPHEVTEGTNQD